MVWFSNQWKLETSSLNSNEKLSFVFDLNNLLASDSIEIVVKTDKENKSKHYTRISLLNHTTPDDFEFYKDKQGIAFFIRNIF